MLIHTASNTGNGNATSIFYKGLVEFKSDDVFGRALWFGVNQLDNLQAGTLTWQCYKNALPGREKLSRHGKSMPPLMPKVS